MTTAMTRAETGRWACGALFFANGLMIGSWGAQIPQLLPRFGIDKATVGLLLLTFAVGAVTALLLSGRLIARFGSRRVAVAAALGVVPMLPLTALAPDMTLIVLALIPFGATLLTMDVAMNANAVEVETAMGRAVMSSLHGFWSLGAAAGLKAGGILVEDLGFGAAAVAAAAVFLLLVLAAMPFLHGGARPAVAADAPREALLPRDLALWVLGAMALFSMVPEGAVIDWAAIYLARDMAAADSVATSGAAGFMVAMAIVRFAGDAIRNRVGAVRTLRLSALVGAAGMAMAAFAPGVPLAVAGFFLAGIGVANMIPVIFSAAGNHPGLSPAAGIAAVSLLGYCGILVAPATIGWIAQVFGFVATFGGLAVLLAVVAALAGRARAAERT
jgi:fucose permease